MASKIVVAVSAYSEPASLADQIANIRHFVDPAALVVFDCSQAQSVAVQVDAEVCPTSRPLRWGHLVPFYDGVMRWARDWGLDYDYLVAVHSDTLVVRHGLAEHLDAVAGDSEFIAPGYLRADEWTLSRIPCLRWFNNGWKRIWGPLFGIDTPSWSGGPVQIFRKGFVEKALAFPAIDRLTALGERSRITGIEEMLYATLADAMGCDPIRLPGENGCHQPIVDLPRLRAYLDLPTVHIIHKVSLEPEDPVRLALADLRLRGTSPLLDLPAAALDEWPPGPPAPPVSVRDRLKELYFHFFP